MNLFTIDEKKCKRDGICVAECPLKLIEMKESAAVPTPVADAESRCIKCGHCVAVCPHNAFTHMTMNTADFPLVRKDLALSPEQAEHFLRSRRSIRAYQDKTVDRETLAKIIDIARYAPTGSNSQQVGWIVVDTRDNVQKLSAMIIDLLRAMIKANHPMAQSYNLANLVGAWDAGIDLIGRNAPALVIAHGPKHYPLAHVDCASALSYFDLAAPTFGIGTCWAGFFMLAIPQSQAMQDALALPEGNAVFGALMAGYPKYTYRRLPPRSEAAIIWKQ